MASSTIPLATATHADKSKNVCQYCSRIAPALHRFEDDIGQPSLWFCGYPCYYKYAMWSAGW